MTSAPERPRPASRLLASPLCELVFSGRYTELLKQTIDSRSGAHAAEDTPFVVGALAFSGRQDEAVAAFRWWTKAHGDDAVVLAACHFFLCVGECRSGRYAAAIEHARAVVRARAVVSGEPLCAFFAHQALGLLRHFTGRARSASRHAAAARQAALEARFSYGRMLALDLLGHALVLEGQIHAGISVLEQSAELAESLGLVANAGAPRVAAAAYRARYAVAGFDAPAELGRLVGALRPEDAYSRRMLLCELAVQLAFAGDGARARGYVDEAARIALPDGDRRARVRLLVADAIVTGFAREGAPAVEKLALARGLLVRDLDDGLEVEIAWAEALVRGTLLPADPAARARVASLARRTSIGRARILSGVGGPVSTLDPRGEDRAAALIAALTHDREEARRRVVAHALWGWLPRVHDLAPGRRLYLLHAEDLLVGEDHGTVIPLEMPGAVLVRLLGALASGPTQKDALMTEVWGIKAYRAERHDSLVHTTISRLRAALGATFGAWIRATDAGYALADGVALVHVGEPDRSRARPETEPPGAEPVGDADGVKAGDERSGASSAAASSEAPGGDPTSARREHVLRLVTREPLSTSEIAAGLRISEMTAFRLLASMTKDGLLERTGQGKKTRYRLVRS